MNRPLTFSDSHFTLTIDAYSIRLWCAWCEQQGKLVNADGDAGEVEYFFPPVSLQEVNQRAGVHDITEHAEPAT